MIIKIISYLLKQKNLKVNKVVSFIISSILHLISSVVVKSDSNVRLSLVTCNSYSYLCSEHALVKSHHSSTNVNRFAFVVTYEINAINTIIDVNA